MKSKIYFSPIRCLLFTIIPLLLLLALIYNGISAAIKTTAISTTSETKPFLTVEKPMLGFKISYPPDWNLTDNDFVMRL
jgi:hypothetical protein